MDWFNKNASPEITNEDVANADKIRRAINQGLASMENAEKHTANATRAMNRAVAILNQFREEWQSKGYGYKYDELKEALRTLFDKIN
jgi:hypothetical protein